MNIIEGYTLDWDQNPALATIQSQPSLDWSSLDSQLMKTKGPQLMEESMDESLVKFVLREAPQFFSYSSMVLLREFFRREWF